MIADIDRPIEAKAPHTRTTRRISMDDARAIAEIMAKGHNETKAVLLLNKFTPRAWFNWKTRGNRAGKISELYARTEVIRTDRLVGEIEKAATGSGGIRHDWRAAQFLAGVVDPKFSTTPAASNQSVQITVDPAVTKRLAEICERTRMQMLANVTPALLPAPGPQVQGDEISHVGDDAVVDITSTGPAMLPTPDDWTDGAA